MAQYVYRHAAMAAAVDAANAIALNQLGAAVPITVPQGCTRIKQIGISLSESIIAPAGDEGATIELVMSGNGMAQEVHFPVGSITNDTTTTTGTHFFMPKMVKVDIAVNPGGAIDLNAYQHGVDVGTPQLDICLCFV